MTIREHGDAEMTLRTYRWHRGDSDRGRWQCENVNKKDGIGELMMLLDGNMEMAMCDDSEQKDGNAL